MTEAFRHSFSNAGAMNAVFALAHDRGLWDDLGLAVELVEFPRTGDAVSATMRREVDTATAPGVNILSRAMAGDDPLNVMNLEGENVFAVIAARGVTGPEDLRGATIGTFPVPNQNHAVMSRALRLLGVDPASEVEFRTDFPDRAALLAGVDSGEIRAMCMTVPTTFVARRMGLPILLDFVPRHEPYQLGAVVATRRLAEQRPDALQRFLVGSLRGAELFRSGFEVALPYLRARSKLADEEVLRATYDLFAAALAHPLPTAAPLEAVRIDLEASIQQPVTVDPATLVDPSFLQTALAPRG